MKFNEVLLRIPVTPTPKARPRFTRFGRTYTPQKTVDYEKAVAEAYKTQTNGFKFEANTALCVSLLFGMPIPKSTSKANRKLMLNRSIKHTKKPDSDNLAKAVLDALNGIAWADDSQIIRLLSMKEYADEPYIQVYIHESLD